MSVGLITSSSGRFSYSTLQVQGVMPVACVRNLYVVERSVAVKMVEWNAYDNHLEPDISFCKTLFENRVPVFISNVHNYG